MSDSTSIPQTLIRGLPVFLIAAVIVGLAELGARRWMGDDETWSYWNRTMASKVRYLNRRAESGKTPDTYILGDSSAAFNVVPSVLDDALGTQSFNLGSAGNYPRSFDLVMRQHVLQRVPVPDRVVLSFAGLGFLPSSKGQTERVLSSPIGQRLQEERVWGDWIWLVRMHHLLRLSRDPPVAPTVFRNRGFEEYAVALQRRARRPRLGNQLPPPPELLVRRRPPPDDEEFDAFGPLERFFDWAAEHDVDVVMLAPPSDEEPILVEEVKAICARRGVPHLDYSDAPLPSHNHHLNGRHAKVFSAKLAQDIKALEQSGWTPPTPRE